MTKEVSILNTKGSAVGQIALDEKVFGVEPNLHVMHLALRRQLNNGRAGTACTKTRAEVSGGGKKPWKQKGTGRARAGSLRSPLFVGGGVVFGPKPRSFEINMPQKARYIMSSGVTSSILGNSIKIQSKTFNTTPSIISAIITARFLSVLFLISIILYMLSHICRRR